VWRRDQDATAAQLDPPAAVDAGGFQGRAQGLRQIGAQRLEGL